jgi:hypothetical protein
MQWEGGDRALRTDFLELGVAEVVVPPRGMCACVWISYGRMGNDGIGETRTGP